MATVQGVYIAIFGRPADPVGLAYWNDVTDNGADLSAMIAAFTDSDEFRERFDGQSNSEIVTSIYTALFGRAPDAEGLAFYTEALDNGELPIETIAVNILDGAQNEDQQMVENKEAAADKFTASLDTPEEIAAYSGENAENYGEAFLNKVTDDPETVPTDEEVEQATDEVEALPPEGQAPQEPEEPEQPGNPGGGTSDPDVADLSDEGILTIASGANASMIENGDSVVISASGFESLVVAKADLDGVYISSGAQFNVAGSVIDNLDHQLSIEGTGTINFTGVEIADATVAGGPGISGVDTNNVAFVIDTDFTDLDAIPEQEVPRILANGTQSEGIAFAWVYQDVLYTEDNTAADINNGTLTTNLLGLEIAKQYAAMLDADPSSAILDFTAKFAEGSRDQSLHDNLMGNAAEGAISGSRYGVAADDAAAKGITSEQVEMLKDAQPDPYSDRPYYSGVPGSDSDGNDLNDQYEAAAWDAANGIVRDDVTPSTYAPSQPENWLTDRAPLGGSKDQTSDGPDGANDVLAFVINKDGESGADAHDRYQGAKPQSGDDMYDLAHGAEVSFDFYIDPDWTSENDQSQASGIWIQMQNADGSLDGGGRFSIAEYVDADQAKAFNHDSAGFRIWNSDEGWFDFIGTGEEDGWVSLSFDFSEDAHTWTITTEAGSEQSTYSGSAVDESVKLETVIVNSQNFGNEDTYYYDNLELIGVSLNAALYNDGE